MAILNKVQPAYTARSAFSPWRYRHHHFIFQPRTIVGTNPHHTQAAHNEHGPVFRQDWQDEAFFMHANRPGPTGSACADACWCYEFGA